MVASFVVGLIGSGIQASRTPRMHEWEADALGLRYVYRLIDLDPLRLTAADLPELLQAAQRMGFAGLNITHPCKQAVVPLLDELSPDARAIGAVNTVLFAGARRIGHNTDWYGFAQGFRQDMTDASLNHVVQLGAGGAGAAVAHALLSLGTATLSLVDIDASRAADLVRALCARFGSGRALHASHVADALPNADGLVHCTPVGMASHPGLPLDAGLLRRHLWVAEIVYFPMETGLLLAARAMGCRTLDGGAMAVHQAAEAFRLFTGVTPDANRMRRHFASFDTR